MPTKVTDPYLLELLNSNLSPDRIEKRMALKAKYDAEAKEQGNPASSSDWENFMAGAGRGAVNTGRQATNMLLPDALTPDFATDEAIANADERDEALLNTKAGMVGDMAGSIAATAPIFGGIAGGAAKLGTKAGALGKTAQLLYGGPVRRVIGEGAAQGALYAKPGERLEGAATGAILSGAMHGGAKALRRVGTGLVKMKGAAHKLAREGVFVPLGLGAQESGLSGTARALYRDVFPNVYTLGGKLRTQVDDAFRVARQKFMGSAVPDSVKSRIDWTAKPQQIFDQLKNYWDTEAYSEIKKFPFNAGDTWVGTAFKTVIRGGSKEARDDILGELNQLRKAKKNVLIGADLLDLEQSWKGAVSELRSKTRQSLETKQQIQTYENALKSIRNLMDDNFQGSPPDIMKVYDDYKALSEPYRAYQDLRDAIFASSDKGGDFSMQNLAKASAKRVGKTSGAAGRGYLQSAAMKAGEVLDKPLPPSNPWRTLLSTSAVLAPGALGGAMSLPIYGTLATALTKTGQKALSGQTDAQFALAKFLKRYSAQNRKIGSVVRNAAVARAVKNDEDEE